MSSTPDSSLSAPIDLNRVRTLFDEPARLAESNFLRREVATRMHERLALVRIAPERVLDAGCGEGADLTTLQKRFPKAAMLGLDVSLNAAGVIGTLGGLLVAAAALMRRPAPLSAGSAPAAG